MNTLVLVIAGVLVVLGIVLIALSVILSRKQASGDEPAAEPSIPEQAESAAFIDQPLQTDMAAELGPTASAVAETSPLENAGVEPPQNETALPAQTEDPTEETPAVAAAAVAADNAPEKAPEGRASLQQVSHDFRVQLASKYLENDLFDEAVLEFEKAASLTTDPRSKLNIYLEIGNVRRAQRRYGEARAAYDQAAEYSRDHALHDHLSRTSQEMRRLEAHDDTGGSTRTGKED